MLARFYPLRAFAKLYQILVREPAQNDLGVGLSVFFAQFGKQRFFDQRLVAVAKRIPGLDDDALFVKESFQFLFLRIGVHLGLQNGGFDLAYAQDLADLRLIEVGKAIERTLPSL